MANLQPLSPQGYNIQDAPLNTNPFWDDDENPDPTIYTRLTALEEDVDDLETYKADKSQLDNYYTKVEITDIVNNIPIFDSTLYYNKTQTDGNISQAKTEVMTDVATSYYNKAEVDNKLAVKANVSAFNNYYNKTDIDGIVDDLQDDIGDVSTVAQQASTDVGNLNTTVNNLSITVNTNTGDISNLTTRVGATESDIATLQTGKADVSTTYTKTQVDTLLADKADITDLPDMTNYYTKTETYSKTEIDNIIGNINTVLESVLNGGE